MMALIFGVKEYIIIEYCHKQGWRRRRKYGPARKETHMKCEVCSSKLVGGRVKYCSNECRYRKKREEKDNVLQRWLAGGDVISDKYGSPPSCIREYLIEICENKCSKCGWDVINKKSGRCPLELNHIDGDCNNNHITNLEILCPNCHSLTENYRRLNKKSSRRYKIVFTD